MKKTLDFLLRSFIYLVVYEVLSKAIGFNFGGGNKEVIINALIFASVSTAYEYFRNKRKAY